MSGRVSGEQALREVPLARGGLCVRRMARGDGAAGEEGAVGGGLGRRPAGLRSIGGLVEMEGVGGMRWAAAGRVARVRGRAVAAGCPCGAIARDASKKAAGRKAEKMKPRNQEAE